MVVARDGDGGHFCEGLRCGVPVLELVICLPCFAQYGMKHSKVLERESKSFPKCNLPEFGDELWGLVREADGVVLAAGDEDLAVGEDDAVVEGARVGHGVYCLYVRGGVRV